MSLSSSGICQSESHFSTSVAEDDRTAIQEASHIPAYLLNLISSEYAIRGRNIRKGLYRLVMLHGVDSGNWRRCSPLVVVLVVFDMHA